MENRIGRGLIKQEGVPLELGNTRCDMCVWLERGYQTSEEPLELESYATEILMHRRTFHIFSADHVN